MSDFLTFRKMLVPLVAEVAFILGTVLCVLGGVLMLAGRGSVSRLTGLSGALAVGAALALALLGPVALRIVLELLVVLFSIQETLIDVRNELRANRQGTSQGQIG